jgi:hypothetical protein
MKREESKLVRIKIANKAHSQVGEVLKSEEDEDKEE